MRLVLTLLLAAIAAGCAAPAEVSPAAVDEDVLPWHQEGEGVFQWDGACVPDGPGAYSPSGTQPVIAKLLRPTGATGGQATVTWTATGSELEEVRLLATADGMRTETRGKSPLRLDLPDAPSIKLEVWCARPLVGKFEQPMQWSVTFSNDTA